MQNAREIAQKAERSQTAVRSQRGIREEIPENKIIISWKQSAIAKNIVLHRINRVFTKASNF